MEGTRCDTDWEGDCAEAVSEQEREKAKRMSDFRLRPGWVVGPFRRQAEKRKRWRPRLERKVLVDCRRRMNLRSP